MNATKTATIQFQNITAAHVRSVYSGKPGCMCGCKGKHYYNPAHRDEATTERGYAIKDDELSPRMVSRVLKMLQQDPSTVVEITLTGILYADIGERVYAVYLCNNAPTPIR